MRGLRNGIELHWQEEGGGLGAFVLVDCLDPVGLASMDWMGDMQRIMIEYMSDHCFIFW